MADPFRTNSKSQLLREAQVGLSVVAILLVLLVYVAFYRITGRGRHIPDHVRNAPVAQLVWPGEEPKKGLAIREIEMTPQEFRDTRMPPTASAFASHAVIPTVKKNVTDSAHQSTYRVTPSAAAMAQKKTSRPKVSLDRRNFSPSNSFQPSVGSGSEFLPGQEVPVVEPVEKVASKTHEPAQALSNYSQSNHFKSESTDAPVVSSAIQVVSVDESESEPKIQLALLETDGNDFMIELPTKDESAATKVLQPDGSNAKAVLPKPLRSEPGFPPRQKKSQEFKLGNDFNPSGFRPELSRDDESFEKVTSGAITAKTPAPNVLSKRMPLKSPLNSALELAAHGFKPPAVGSPDSLPDDLTDPFLDPVLAPSRPLVDRNNDRSNAKRLPSLSSARAKRNDRPTNSFAPTSIAPSSSGFKQSKSEKSNHQSEPAGIAENPLEYVTQPGDSFWSISQSVYNDGRYFRALYKYNEPQVPEFDSLQPGTKLGTPSQADLFKLWPDLCPASGLSEVTVERPSSTSRVYTTRIGDTVFDIARQRLGQASRYAEILKLNEIRLGQEINHLTPLNEGVRLALPAE